VAPISTGNRNTQYNAPGYPLYGMWGKRYTWNDPNGDGILGLNDLTFTDTAVYIGPSFPTLEFAVTPRVELFKRKLAITAQLDHKQGMRKLNNTLRHQCQGGQSCRGLYDPKAPLALQAAAIAANNYSVFTGMYDDGKFSRLRELSVSYELPRLFTSRIRASRAMLVGTGRNLGVWTPFTGVDPETTVGNTDSRGNEEFFSTPPLRYFTIRLNVTF
jgi:hypothetical protein